MKIARIHNNKVIELIPDQATPINLYYSAAFVKECAEVPDEVMPNWGWDYEKQEWVPENKFLTLSEKIKNIFKND